MKPTVFESQKIVHAPSAHCKGYFTCGTRLIWNNLSFNLNYSLVTYKTTVPGKAGFDYVTRHRAATGALFSDLISITGKRT
jgi:hypothetical protein